MVLIILITNAQARPSSQGQLAVITTLSAQSADTQTRPSALDFCLDTDVLMFFCPVCQTPADNLYEYKHYKIHSNIHNINIPCVNQDCCKKFRTFNALRVHVSPSHVQDNIGP